MENVTDPKITVLMSVYNGMKYLPQAIESILGQSYEEFEFLIIDDGSTEPVADLITAYRDDRIVLIEQENVGLTKSLNRGFHLARGEYVARMDADDVSHPRRLEAQVAELGQDRALDLVGTFFEVIDQEGGVLETKNLIEDPIYRLWRLLFHNNYGHGTVLLRKQAVIEVGMYNEALRHAQDYDLWSRLSGKANTAIVPEVLYSYRMVHESDQTSVKNYDSQLLAAIGVSNRSLMACNADLSEDDCEEVRALYWKFQRDTVTVQSIEAIPRTLEGFCQRYGIDGHDKARLMQDVLRDAQTEVKQQEQAMSRDFASALNELRMYAERGISG
jgi:glycosyltransferase involved in cell wall biosynthesis